MNYKKTEKRISEEVSRVMDTISEEQVQELFEKINKADKVFFVGVGRVLLSLEAIAKRLAHLGVFTVVVGQITEPAITKDDLLIVGSGSGESAFPLAIAKKARQFGVIVAHIGSNPNSSMKAYTDCFVRIPVQTKLNLENEIPSIQPMSSLFEQCLLLLGDTIALMMIEDEEIDIHGLWRFHANLE